MRIIEKMLKMDALYWAPGDPPRDNYGKPTYINPVEIPCRWEVKAEEFIDPQGERQVSKARVFTGIDVAVGGVLRSGLFSSLPNLVIDPGLDNPAAWTGDPEWWVNLGYANCIDGDNDYIEPAVALDIVAGYTYQVVFEFTAYTKGRIRPIIGGTNGTERIAVDTYTEIITAINTDNLKFQGWGLHGGTCTGSIDNIFVRLFSKPKQNEGAFEIRGRAKIPTLKATQFVRMAYL